MKRKFLALGLTFLLVAALVLVACGPAEEEPVVEEPVVEEPVVEEPVVEEPVVEPEDIGAYHEAPMLEELVEEGLLPPVEERLPMLEDILVHEPLEEIGTYGGTWRRTSVDDGAAYTRKAIWEPLMMWYPDHSTAFPNVIKGWEKAGDGKSITFFLRRGLKWSDGVPFTTEDIRFWWEDLALDKDFGDVLHPNWAYVEGKEMTMDFIDDYTFRMNFGGPNWTMPYGLVFWYFTDALTSPRHYLEQFHPRYNPELLELDEPYEELGKKRLWWQNTDHPTINAWILAEHVPGERFVWERNPYYWKVDTAGNQLPYIDRIVSIIVPNEEVRLMKLLAGEIDATFYQISSARDIPVIMDGLEAAGLRRLDGWWKTIWGGWPLFSVNQEFVGDEYIRELLYGTNFRRGLSVAIDREHLNDILWYGLAKPMQSVHFGGPLMRTPEFEAALEEAATMYIQYDVDLANQFLDAAGLDARDPDTDYRLRADTGEVFELMLDVGASEIYELTAALLKQYFEAVGIKTILNFAPPAEISTRLNAGIWHLRMESFGDEPDPFVFPWILFPIISPRATYPESTLWWTSGGEQGVEPEPGSRVARLFALYNKGISEPNWEKRELIGVEAIQIYIEEGPVFIGITGRIPEAVFVKKNLRNIPNYGITGGWHLDAPIAQEPFLWFFKTE